MNEKGIVFDLETTGINNQLDEIVSISIIDLQYNVLLNSLVKPVKHTQWDRAEKVHGISPVDVRNAPTFAQLLPTIKTIFEKADLIVGYNIQFDLGFLPVDLYRHKKTFDVMIEFAKIYGKWDEYHKSYTWQKLSTCAQYYGYEFIAHDSLEDVKATLFAYHKILKAK